MRLLKLPPSVCLKSYFGWKLGEVEFQYQKYPFCFHQGRRKLQEQRAKGMYQVLKAIVEASVQICPQRWQLHQSWPPTNQKGCQDYFRPLNLQLLLFQPVSWISIYVIKSLQIPFLSTVSIQVMTELVCSRYSWYTNSNTLLY